MSKPQRPTSIKLSVLNNPYDRQTNSPATCSEAEEEDDDEEEEIKDVGDGGWEGGNCQYCCESMDCEGGVRRVSRPHACLRILRLWLLLLLGGSMVALVVVLVLVVEPYRRAHNFLQATCVTVDVRHVGWRACSCGKACASRFPCILLTIQYNQTDLITEQLLMDDAGVRLQEYPHTESYVKVAEEESDEDIVLAELRENEATQPHQCSYFPSCQSSRSANRHSVEQYEHRYGQLGKTFSCLYNPHHPGDVIRTRRFRLHHVIHALIWSCVLLGLSVALLVVARRRKKCQFL